MSSTIISAGLKSRVRLNESTIPDEVFKLSANTEYYREHYIFLEKKKSETTDIYVLYFTNAI